MPKIKTSKIAAFLNTATTATPTWSRIKKQTELTLKYNANTTEDKWIDEDAPSTSTDSYGVSLDGELVCHDDDPLFDYLDGLRQKRAIDAACETDIMIVYIYDGTEGAYKAEQNKCSIQIGEFSGDGGGGNASLKYTVTFNGSPTLGTCAISSGIPTFTAD